MQSHGCDSNPTLRPPNCARSLSRFHRRFRQLGQLDRQGIPRNQPRAHSVRARGARGGSLVPVRWSWTPLPAAAPSRSKRCAWVQTPLPVTSIPIPVLLNKVVLEYIPKYGQRLADEVRKWGEWIKHEAEKELAEFYPKDADGATPIAYLWARTIQCEGPGCGAEVPLIRSLWLAKKTNRSVALQLLPDQRQSAWTSKSSSSNTAAGWTRTIQNQNRRPEVRRHGQTRLRHLPVLRLHDTGRTSP